MVTFSPEASAAIINTDTSCVTGSAGAVGNINPGTTGTQATDGSGTYSLVAGCNAKGNNNLAATVFGSFSEVTGTAGTALGHNSQANAFGTAVGVESRATAAGSTAIGEGTQSTGQNAVALGGTATGTAAGNVLSVANAVTASGSGAVAIGGNATRGAQSAGTDAVAIGAQSTVAAAGTGAVALGARSNASATTTVAIGDGANASIAGSIALGASSTTSASVNSTAQTINGKSYTATGTASTGVVSVGSGSIKRQIQNVAAGQVTASSTDAVNGSQLFNTNTELAKVATDTAAALGGGAAAGTTAGGITAPSYTITKTDASTTTVHMLASSKWNAFKHESVSATKKPDIQKGVDAKNAVDTAGLKFKGDTATTSNTKKLGDTVSITGDTNISTVATTDGVQVKLNPNLDLGATGSVKTGNTTINNAGESDWCVKTGNTTINNAGVTADQVTVGGVVINNTSGINAGGKAITNVAAPTNNTDAANKKYVDDAGTALTNLGFGLKATRRVSTDVTRIMVKHVDIVSSNRQHTIESKCKVKRRSCSYPIHCLGTTGTTGSVTTGSTVINNAGVTANKVTINNARNTPEVAAGSNVSGVVKTTGANGQDVYTVNANGTTASAGSSAVTVTPGTKDANNVTDYKVDLSATTKTDIQKGVDAKTAVDTTGLKFKGAGDNVVVTSGTNADGSTNYEVATAKDVNFDKVTVGSVVVDKSSNTIKGLSNTTWNGTAVSGQAATEKTQLQLTVSACASAITTTTSHWQVRLQVHARCTQARSQHTGGTSLRQCCKCGCYKDVANASKGVNAGDLNNAVVDATNAATSQRLLHYKSRWCISSRKPRRKQLKLWLQLELNKNLEQPNFGITVNDGTNGTNGSTVIGKDGISVKDGSGNTIAGVDNTALTVKDGSGNTETSINQAINTLNAAQGETDKFAVKYDKNADGSANYNNITLAGTTASSTQDATTGKITTTGGTSLNNVASAGDYKDVANASKGVNAGDLNNAVVDATNAATSKGFALQAADGAKVQKNLGEAVEVVGADSNITTKVAGGQVAIELNKNLNNLTGITVNDGTNGTNGSTVIGKDGISVKDGSGNTIAGVDNTALTVKDGSGNTETSINQAINTLNAAQGETDKFAVKYDKNADGSVNYNNVTLAGTNGTIIRNVKAGAVTSTSTDAINGSQLYGVANSVKNAIGGSTTIDATTGAITTTNIGGTGSNTIDGAISSIKDSATKAKTTVNGSTNYEVATAKDVNFDKVTVGNVVVDKANDTIQGLSNKDLNSSDFATKGRAATEEQLKAVITSNITEVVDGNGNKVNIIDQVVNTKPDNKNQDSLFLTYDKQGQETTDRLTIGQTVQKMNTDGIKFFHTNADTSKGDLGTTNDSSAGGLNSTAIGVNAIVANGADSSVALGHNTKVNGKQSIAIGSGAEALGNQSISIGTGNKVTGDHSGAIGDPTIVNGANSYSVGNNNQVLTDDTFVLGNNVTKTVAGSVVLGNGSAATTGAGEAGYALSVATNADKAAINKTTSSTGAVAVGDASSGIYRQITGVAAGSVDSDAVNVAQLKAVGNQVVTTQTTLVNSLGGNAKVNADGTITGPTYNVAQGNQTNVGDALTALDNAINTAATTSKSTVSNGQNIVVSKSKNADGSDNYEVSTAKDLTVDSVKAGDTVLNNAGITIGNNAVVLNNTGLTISGGPSVTLAGINAGNKTIQNVANAVNATDAVNKGQLDSAINNVNNNVNELANNAVKYDDASKDKITLGGGATGTTITNVKDGTVAQGSKDAVNGGQLWNVQQQVDQNTTDISNIKNDINNGTVGLVQQAGKDAPVTVAKDTGGTTVNVAGTDGNRVVTGVKEGAVNATSKDAVNGSQLNTTNQAVVNYLGGGAGYDNITGSFTAPSYTVGDSKYNNVGGAIDALNQADQALNSKIDNVSNKLDNAFRITNNRIDDVEKKANAGIAAAMALESAPYVPGKYTYAAGAAYHGGENAVGVTLRKTADNGRWSITGGVAAASQGDASVRIGISGVID
ncbi:hypothetical protein FQR65_LT17809 [Abscondita terminalis]|nr:hypothetical protein FQR65_LT17809 [Abscondita terminalis]